MRISSDKYVTGKGIVKQINKDTGKKKDHDELILLLEKGKVIRLSHNKKLGGEVDADPGDEVAFHGYNIPGTNVVHKTHDNKGELVGGLEVFHKK